jgi:hypothetical protein
MPIFAGQIMIPCFDVLNPQLGVVWAESGHPIPWFVTSFPLSPKKKARTSDKSLFCDKLI